MNVSTKFSKAHDTECNRYFAMAFACCIVFLLSGCLTSEDDSSPFLDALTGGSSMSAQVDGKTWSSNAGAYFIPWGKGISITAISGFDELFTLTIDSSAVGEYQVSRLTSYAMGLQVGEKTYLAKQGVIRITSSNSEWVQGTFEGELIEDIEGIGKTITIQNGKFKATVADKSLIGFKK